MKLYPMICGSLGGRVIWGGIDTCVGMAEFLQHSPKAITTLFLNQLYPDTK